MQLLEAYFLHNIIKKRIYWNMLQLTIVAAAWNMIHIM
jgi:hypothetical protein